MDQHVPRAITIGLRLRGADVITAFEDGTSTMDDSQLLSRAAELVVFFLPKMMTSLLRLPNAKEPQSDSMELFTLINCARRSALVLTT